MFKGLVREWFSRAKYDYNDFVKALPMGDLKAMNYYMNKVAPETFSYFDTGSKPSVEESEERIRKYGVGFQRKKVLIGER